MNSLTSIITTLTEEEKRGFINILKQKNKRNDTRNVTLFKLLDTQKDVQNPDIILYGKKATGAFHALCKRLHDSLIDFIASKSFETETSEEMDILKLLLASRIFFEQKQYKIAFKTLKKAEQKAKVYDLYSILQEIYYTKIQYAHLYSKQPLPELIVDLHHNRQLLLQEENLNLLYATLQQIPPNKTPDIDSFLKNTMSQLNISIGQGLTFRSLFKILEAVNKTAHIHRKHQDVLPFVSSMYEQITKKENLTEKHLFYHIQILYYVANAYFRNKEFDTSMQYLQLMDQQMQKQRKKYEKRFIPQYTLLTTLNLNYTGQADRAIELLKIFDYQKHKDQVTYILDLKLSLLVFYFQQEQFNNAFQVFKEFYHSDTWYTQKAGILWVLKKNLIEILLHLELDHIDLVTSRLASFGKKHLTYLKEKNETRVIDFMRLLSAYHKDPEIITSRTYKITIGRILSSLTLQEDIFELSFYAWLKSKINQTELYDTTLELVNR